MAHQDYNGPPFKFTIHRWAVVVIIIIDSVNRLACAIPTGATDAAYAAVAPYTRSKRRPILLFYLPIHIGFDEMACVPFEKEKCAN